ncbi:hypothetical protein JM93_00857 [Roseibium hamelinense]|uniref:Uncharacterized protein n=1 Tax=Roseibium hamelinense TaxID=150831 RepID=A0A562TI20_9HYPH|nr:hypothetical protein JM93_00857 [Roseibium hamelinense]
MRVDAGLILPGFPQWRFQVRSPLTVAGAVTDLAPDGYTAPCSLFIPIQDMESETMDVPDAVTCDRLSMGRDTDPVLGVKSVSDHALAFSRPIRRGSRGGRPGHACRMKGSRPAPKTELRLEHALPPRIPLAFTRQKTYLGKYENTSNAPARAGAANRP